MHIQLSDLPAEYVKAVEEFVGNGKIYKLTQERLNSLWDIEFGLAMFNAGKNSKE